MPDAQRQLFRETALHHYFHRREKDVLPRVVKPPVFLCCWLFAALLLLLLGFSWWQEVPLFAEGSAFSLQDTQHNHVMLVVLPERFLHRIHVGSECHVRFQETEPYRTCTVKQVNPTPSDPQVLQQRYHLRSAAMQQYQQPLVSLEVTVSQVEVADELPQARIQIGSQRLLTLLSNAPLLGA